MSFCSRLLSATVIALQAFQALAAARPAWADADCRQSSSSFPLDDFNLSNLTGETSQTLANPPSDTEIFTAQDKQYCGRPVTPTRTIDPRSLPDDGTIWRVGSNRWTLADEKAYSDWVKKEVDRDFFVRYQIPTDCADAALSIRLIYSRIRSLPASIQTGAGLSSHTSRAYSGKRSVSDWSGENWKHALKNDERFRAWLFDIQKNVGTVNLASSTYPIQLSTPGPRGSPRLSSYVSEGAVVLDAHHTRFISAIDTLDRVEPIRQLSSTVPRDVRQLASGAVDIWSDGHDEVGRGILKFNWSVNCGRGFELVADQKMPGYSLQQYQTGRMQDEYLVEVTPGKRGPADKGYVDHKYSELKTRIISRLNLVSEAQQKLKANPRIFDDPQSTAYDSYSTPSRDSSLRTDMGDLESKALYGEAGVQQYLESKFSNGIIVLGNGHAMTYSDFQDALEQGLVSSDPRASVDDRWGWKIVQQKADRLKQKRTGLEAQIKRDIAALGFMDSLLYKAGQLELPSEKELKVVKAQLQVLKSRGART